ncbi:MAG: Response regulator of zinc sigma-54-dependent two-component system [Labilithrix sp.]|nr:Response regulator of zinc sigma-54-dependent two-component system [Labilithrix sp.]
MDSLAVSSRNDDNDAPAPSSTGCQVTAVRQTSRGRLVVRSKKMHAVLTMLERVASASCTVLVTGESGTGKELAVALLHDASPRRAHELVAVNCGAIPENLVESELFGHARGAFTGAVCARRGLVAAAEGGTLFLDEIGELPLGTQVKLLRLIQEREYTPVGESRPIKADVRIVAATHRDLAAEVKAGRFREDLYHRLNVINVRLPPLRERPEDIVPLASAFLRVAAERVGRPDVTGFAPGVLEHLVAWSWPGNVRALENAIERGVVLATGDRVELEGLPEELQPPPTVRSVAPPAPEVRATRVLELRPVTLAEGITGLRGAVEAFENDLIMKALTKTSFNKQKAANILGLKRTTLIEMMKRKGFERPETSAAQDPPVSRGTARVEPQRQLRSSSSPSSPPSA